jgi:hypothetical protein
MKAESREGIQVGEREGDFTDSFNITMFLPGY